MTPRKRLNHEAPFWITSEAEYFLTICAEPRGQNHFSKDGVGPAILDAVSFYNERQTWFCSVVLLMPDHIHMLVSFPPDAIPSKVVGLWKRGLAKTHAISWQPNFFEHRLRNGENVQSKAEYILQNPIRAGLVTDWRKWPYYWIPDAY